MDLGEIARVHQHDPISREAWRAEGQRIDAALTAIQARVDVGSVAARDAIRVLAQRLQAVRVAFGDDRAVWSWYRKVYSQLAGESARLGGDPFPPLEPPLS